MNPLDPSVAFNTGKPRVRFAPSPTGYLHVGGVRTALTNWLFARQTGGTFILRIEDTDAARNREKAVRLILDELRRLGLDWDEGPEVGGPCGSYFQSERMDVYRKAMDQLLASGRAYWAKKEAAGPLPEWKVEKLKKAGQWDEERAAAATDPKEALYLKVDLKGRAELTFGDLIKGEMRKPADTYEDFVIARSNGMPVYNFACVVDDSAMGITHVLRGDDHVENTFRQILIAEALEAPVPRFGHLPMIFNEQGQKLSKRRDPVAVTTFFACGILPEALFNYETLLGWSPGDDREFMKREEIVAAFSLERVKKSPAMFTLNRKREMPVLRLDGEGNLDLTDPLLVEWLSEALVNSKLEWLNGEHWKALSPAERLHRTQPFFAAAGYPLETRDRAWLSAVVEAVGERARTAKRMAEQAAVFFQAPREYNAKDVEKFLNKNNGWDLLAALRDRLSALSEWTAALLEETVQKISEERGLKTMAAAQPLRVALVGRAVSPAIGVTTFLVGREETVRRIALLFAQANRSSETEPRQ
jgi:glutamyl-tRNA synthetase